MPISLNRFLAIIALLGFAPLMIVIAFLIFWEDGYPILFRQKRVGINKTTFTIYKFRTMRDEKVTRIGHLLRKTGLDELAQFFNVLKGNMNIVGPRPLTWADIYRLGWDDPEHQSRWKIKPGITGLSQIFAGRGANESWKMDQVYSASISFWKDLKIIFISFCINFFGKQNIRRQLKLEDFL